VVNHPIPGLGSRRVWAGIGATAVGLAGLSLLTVPARDHLSLASVALLFLVPVVVAAVVGGVWAALVAALGADLLVNFFFVPPFHTFTVESGQNAIVLVVYVAVAATVAVAVDIAARQRAAAGRRALEAALLARTTAEPVTETSLEHLLDQVRTTFGMTAVALLERGDDQQDHVVAQLGEPPDDDPAISTTATGGLRLLGWGPALFAEDRRVLDQLAAAAARTLEAQRLARQATHARELAEIDRLRTGLLTAVGHDLRTPLAGIKAAVSSLRQPDVAFTPEDRAELHATIEESTDRLTGLVENLLSMSRLQAGVLSLDRRPVPLDAVVAEALLPARAGESEIAVHVPDDLPLIYADPGLLERVIANLLANAQAANRYHRPIELRGRPVGDQIALQVIDHGPGVPAVDRERMFTPFQRLDDRASDGLGLGLAVARGFTEAMGGTLTPTGTPGGGLTMTITIPTAP
jgi:two-component system sensor histidine kinase KdpD